MIFTITATHTGHAIAELEYFAPLDIWLCNPKHCDMTTRRKPVDGYTFRSPGESVSAHRESLHEALLRLAERGQHSISIRGIQYLRRLADDPVMGPQEMRKELERNGYQ